MVNKKIKNKLNFILYPTSSENIDFSMFSININFD